MKTFHVTLTETEVDLVLKTLDKTATQGIEAQRLVVGLADKILAAVRAQLKAEPEARPADPPPPKTPEN